MSEPEKINDQAEDFGGPLALHSEFCVGEIVRYLGGGNRIRVGAILHILDGYGGQCYIVENQQQGFPDVVFAREIIVRKIVL